MKLGPVSKVAWLPRYAYRALTFSERQTHNGWTIGAGTEYAVTDNVLLRAEYLYTDLGTRNYLGGVFAGGVDANVNFSTVRAGVSFKF